MDRSVDSIGSCSLDVDADSTDFSDTSGSLNLPTPLSGKDITREFTSRIKERCQITQINCHQQTTAVLDPNSGKISTIISCVDSPVCSPVKKPSYLNLACCVNGYSNLTTYDSKLRQNINKSREVSPIRPSSNSTLQTNRLSGNFLALPLTSSQKSPSTETMENRNLIQDTNILSHDLSVDTTDNVANDKYMKSAKFISSSNIKTDIQQNGIKTSSKSFIQQRVERLYGPGALAQGFYSPKKAKSQEISILSERSSNSQIKYSTKTITLEHEINKTTNGKTTTTTSSLDRIAVTAENCENFKNNCDLPVLRHLRPEFRAQLPIMSPKRSPNKFPVNESSSCPVLLNGTTLYMNGSNDKHLSSTTTTILHHSDVVEPKTGTTTTNGTANNINNSIENNVIVSEAVPPIGSIDDMKISEKVTQESECDKSLSEQSMSVCLMEKPSNSMTVKKTASNNIIACNTDELSTLENGKENCKIQDGKYFLELLKTEQDRLLVLAERTENELASLSGSDVSEEIFGYLRSASGKARLLVTQKLKQFEGLCKNNLNPLPGEKFPTTNGDLQGFWDMVMLQVDHVDSLFQEIDSLKANNWQKPLHDVVPNAVPQGSKLIRRPNPTKGSSSSSMANGASSKKSSLLAAQRREAQRKQLMEIKRKNKLAIASAEQQPQPSQSQVVEIFVNEPCSS